MLTYPGFYLLEMAVPLVEIIIAVLLFLPSKRIVGLWATLVLMVCFTGYVGVWLVSDYDLPRTCGGIFRELSWRQYLWVNIGLVILAVLGLVLNSQAVTEKYMYE